MKLTKPTDGTLSLLLYLVLFQPLGTLPAIVYMISSCLTEKIFSSRINRHFLCIFTSICIVFCSFSILEFHVFVTLYFNMPCHNCSKWIWFIEILPFCYFPGFLCPLSANKYGIEFLKFTITDNREKKIIFEVGKDIPATSDVSIDFSAVGDDMYRKIRYNFSEDVLRLPEIETSLLFQVGQHECKDFRMIERHYFKGKLVKSFDFKFGFCIPGSTNNWDALYCLPALSESLSKYALIHFLVVKKLSYPSQPDQLIICPFLV